jgi:hypothetical protein
LRQRVLLGRARSFRYSTCFTMAFCRKCIEISFEQLSHRPNDDAVHGLASLLEEHLTLLAALESDSVVVEEEKSVTIVEHAFVAASGNGFIIESR